MSMIQPGKDRFEEPPGEALPDESAEVSFFAPGEAARGAGPSKAEQARRKHEARLLKIGGVEGVSIDSGDLGEDIVVVFVRDESVVRKVPKTLDGVPVRAEVTGEFDAFLDDVDEIESREPEPPAPKKAAKPKRKTAAKSTASKASAGARRKAASLMDTKGETAKKPKATKPR